MFEAEGSSYFSSATHSFIPSFIVVDSRGGSCPEGPDHPEVRGGGQSLLLFRSTLGRRSYRPCRQQKVLFFHASDPSTINRQKYNFRIFLFEKSYFKNIFRVNIANRNRNFPHCLNSRGPDPYFR